MDYSIPDIAERLGLHTSVVENYEEEWLAEQESEEEDFITESFTDFLCRTFAEGCFFCEAVAGGNAMACLEVYDETYKNIEEVLSND